MNLSLENFSLIPFDYKRKDPRGLLYLYPNSLNIVAYARKMQQFSYYQSLEVAETLAKDRDSSFYHGHVFIGNEQKTWS
ncbi:hypothetical protein AAHH67_10670 [Niallia circulans]